MAIVNLYDRDVELLYEEHILESKKEYSKSWSKILHVLRDVPDARSPPSTPSSALDQQVANMKLRDRERQAIKDRFAVSERRTAAGGRETDAACLDGRRSTRS